MRPDAELALLAVVCTSECHKRTQLWVCADLGTESQKKKRKEKNPLNNHCKLSEYLV